MEAAAASALLLLVVLSAILSLATSASAAAAAPYTPPTVPELLDRFGLPRALLPETARRYLLHDDDGSFELFLDDGCVAEVGGYRVGYDVELSGAVSPGTVTGLKGVRVRVLLAWVPITGVEVAGGEVTVHVGGLIKKSFPVVGFKSSPQCIAGVSCGGTAADVFLPLVEQY